VIKHGVKCLVLALDGLDPDLFVRFRDQMPNLSALAEQGVFCPLRSTTPPMTFPAWSTCLTGVNPGKHGIFDFTERITGKYGVRFLNSTRRRYPTFLRILSEKGFRVGSIGLPTTYPPEQLSAFQISGFDTPLPSKADSSYVYPPELSKDIDNEMGGYYFGNFNEGRIGPAWHKKVLKQLYLGVDRKKKLVKFLAERFPLDLLVLHVGETDTVGHHFWSFYDRKSPRHVDRGDLDLSDAILNVYRSADKLAGDLLDLLEPRSIIVVSDHGMGGTSDRILFLNNFLAEHGFLHFSETSAHTAIIGNLKKAGMKWIPYRWQQTLFKLADSRIASTIESIQRFSGIDWSKTVAFSEELNYFPSIWLNVKGRDPRGIITDSDVDSVIKRMKSALYDWKYPDDGLPVVKQVYHRNEIYEGTEIGCAPDLILELNKPEGYSYAMGRSSAQRGGETCRKLTLDQYLGYKGETMNGSHRQMGTFIAKSDNKTFNVQDDFSLTDISPTILHLFGLDRIDWMDGKSCLAGEQGVINSNFITPDNYKYSNEEENQIRERLSSLGYLE